MLTIRLQRVGKTKHPTYRLIVSEKTQDTHDNYVELLGSFNPHVKENGLILKADRVKYWIEHGSQMSNTVNNLLVNAGLISGKKKKSVYLSDARKAKLAAKKPAPAASASAPAVEAAPAPETSAAPAAEEKPVA